jgi:hypothetical protein
LLTPQERAKSSDWVLLLARRPAGAGEKMMKKIAIAAAALALAAPAMAQAPAPTAKPAATVVEPTKTQIDLARQIVKSNNIDRAYELAIVQMIDQLAASVTRTRPDLIQPMSEVAKGLKPEFDAKRDDIIEKTARIYALNLSEPELKAIADFFATSAGQRFVSTQPKITAEMSEAFAIWQPVTSAFITQRIREELKKKGHEM